MDKHAISSVWRRLAPEAAKQSAMKRSNVKSIPTIRTSSATQSSPRTPTSGRTQSAVMTAKMSSPNQEEEEDPDDVWLMEALLNDVPIWNKVLL